MSELENQMPLFTLDGCDEPTQAQLADEICRDPACWCADPIERAKPERQETCAGDTCWCAPLKRPEPEPEPEADEVCDECGTACTSSKECVELSGLYDEDDQ